MNRGTTLLESSGLVIKISVVSAEFPRISIADMIVGHGNRKKDIQSLSLSVSDQDLLDAIDVMEFDHGETEIWVMARVKVKTRK